MPEEEWQQEDDVTAISIREFADHKEEWVAGRFELIRGRMDDLVKEDMTGFLGERFLKGTALFLHDTLRVFDLKQVQILDGLSFARQKALHDRLYQAPLWDTLPPWPQQAERESPDALFLAALPEWRLAAGYAVNGWRFELTVLVELYLQIFHLFEMERRKELTPEELRQSFHQALYYHFSDYCDVTAGLTYHALLVDGEWTERLRRAEKGDLCGLYRLGGFVGEEALREAERLCSLSESELWSLAEACWQKAGPPESEEKNFPFGTLGRIAIAVPPGRERLAQTLCRLCDERGYRPVALRRQETFMARAAGKEAVFALSLFLDRALKDRCLTEERNAREAYKDLLPQLKAVIDLYHDEHRKEEPSLAGKPGRLYESLLSELEALRSFPPTKYIPKTFSNTIDEPPKI